MARLLVIIILINNLYGKLLTDKEDTLKSSTYNQGGRKVIFDGGPLFIRKIKKNGFSP